jgi:hypothetical protein
MSILRQHGVEDPDTLWFRIFVQQVLFCQVCILDQNKWFIR